MPPKLICPLCETFLEQDWERNHQGPWRWRTRPWFTEVRGLYAVDGDLDQIAVTGVGVIRHDNILHASIDPDKAYFEVEDFNALNLWAIRDFSTTWWCFAFHDSCWNFLLQRLRLGDAFIDVATIVRSVFFQLHNSPAPKPPGPHDSRWLYKTADPNAFPKLEVLETVREGVYAEMHYGRDTTQSEDMALESDSEHSSSYDTGAQANWNESGAGIFRMLPEETIYEVLTYLDIRDVLKLRLTCRYLSWLASNKQLPPSFWRSRFMLGQEFYYIFPDLDSPRNWFRLYSAMKAFSYRPSQALAHRKEICELLEPIASLVELEPTKRNGGQGFSYSLVKSQRNVPVLVNIAISRRGNHHAKVMTFFSGHVAAPEGDYPVQDQCELLYRKAQLFVALRDCRPLRVGISTVEFGSNQFISGIKLFPSSDGSEISQSIGYPNPDTENWIEIPRYKRIRAFEVLFSSEGLKAIRILYTGSRESAWVGQPNVKKLARGLLLVPSGKVPYYLLAGLDRFKIVALGFGEMTEPGERGSRPPRSSAAVTRYSRVASHLWMPPVPLYGSSIISPLLPCRPSGPFNPLLHFDFGFRGGSGLEKLICLEFHMRFYRHPLVGMVAHYSDDKVLSCGVVGENVMSLPMNGPKGERVTQIRILRDNRYHNRAVRLVGLEVSTNYGRTATFAPLVHHLNASARMIPGVPTGHTITGLVAQPAAYRKYFDQLRIHSQKCDAPPAIPDNLNAECHRVPEDQVQYDLMLRQDSGEKDDMKYYQTYASLNGVRKITASTGDRGYFRSKHWITGLKFEYFNHPTPSVVGQWIRPLSNAVLRLSPGEEIRSITVWVGLDAWISQSPESSTGNIAAIWINTGVSRATFATQLFHSGAAIQSQYLSDTDEELTAISWVVSADSDRVRAVISPYRDQRPRTLEPTPSPPYDRVRKLYFEGQEGYARRKKIVQATAYIYDRQLCGLKFTYSSTHQSAVGDIRDCMSRQSLNFFKDDAIIGFSTKISGTALVEIQFEVKQKRTVRCLSLRDPDREPFEYDRHRYWGDTPANLETATDISEQRRIEKISGTPADSRLTGIFVHCDCLSAIGAIYEPTSSR
ncbi:uncharacterized protein AKAW2_21575S [Aspergillus luchuensis]|uniref:F-box domain-containing protein n=1 Tax=Aspergillus kawachii TaxID=1069201 RepID=A0A7R7ZW22_ASPKA|nr:uncharacterized protein AKAW2_21575S [Aspergillus luchuensis]BCR96635.1 hypothetical protein AKAW2_21575S [Aspergillus luchuensis]GAA92520.1 hypothetical protein AKAW_10634 [Aspergillus luchuensis IFO 4308]